MSTTTKAALISMATVLGTTAITYFSNNLTSFGIPAQYLPIAAGLLALAMHWLPTPNRMATSTTLSTSAQK